MELATQQDEYDLLVIGGGINGTGIAADAAGRGLSVLLVEQNDLASGTSSASSKLIHGGLRYLEHYEFRLVREALQEREVLLQRAPHIISPLTFVMPHSSALRPAWLIRAGLFLYDHLARRKRLSGSKAINLARHDYGTPLLNQYKKGFSYADCWVDDARLVITNAIEARQHGADIRTQTQFIDAQRSASHWTATLACRQTQSQYQVQARCLVNAAGPWLNDVLDTRLTVDMPYRVNLIKGSHIVVPKLYDGDQAYILQHTDQRIIFVIPYLADYSLIGTTDVAYHQSPDKVAISDAEKHYLCEVVNEYFAQRIQPRDIVWSYAGLRALLANNEEQPAKMTRDYTLEVNHAGGAAPLLAVFGGKITTYRKLAEHALQLLKPFFPQMQAAWTANQPAPGGDIPDADRPHFCQRVMADYPQLPAALLQRYVHAYGTYTYQLLNQIKTVADLGHDFGHGLYAVEVDYLVQQEWALTAEDILWRRTKLGVVFSAAEQQALSRYLGQQREGSGQARVLERYLSVV